MGQVNIQLQIEDGVLHSHWGSARSLVISMQYESNEKAKEELDKFILQLKMARESLEIVVEDNPRISQPINKLLASGRYGIPGKPNGFTGEYVTPGIPESQRARSLRLPDPEQFEAERMQRISANIPTINTIPTNTEQFASPEKEHVIRYKVTYATGEAGPFDTEDLANQFAATIEGSKVIPVET